MSQVIPDSEGLKTQGLKLISKEMSVKGVHQPL